MTFCPKCGAERKVGSKFCHNCGYDFKAIDSSMGNGNSSSNQSSASSNTNFNGGVNSGTYSAGGVPANQNSHGFAKILGYIFAVLIPVIGIIIGIYLLMSENQEVHKHGKFIIGVAVLIQLISFLSMLG